MALTVETGTGQGTPDSFVSLVEVRTFAVSRGKTVPSDDTELESLVRNAHDYLLTLEDRLKGWRKFAGQALPFPRVGVVLFERSFPSDAIPQQLKTAICQLVIEQLSNELLTPVDTRVVTQETVGPLSTTYAILSSSPSFPKVEAYLAPLLKTGTKLSSVRV